MYFVAKHILKKRITIDMKVNDDETYVFFSSLKRNGLVSPESTVDSDCSDVNINSGYEADNNRSSL